MKKTNKETIKVHYSPEVISAINAEAKSRNISFNKVVEEMIKNFVNRCGTPKEKIAHSNKTTNLSSPVIFCGDGAVHPYTPSIKRITIVEVEVA